jgi:hypothetical protein
MERPIPTVERRNRANVQSEVYTMHTDSNSNPKKHYQKPVVRELSQEEIAQNQPLLSAVEYEFLVWFQSLPDDDRSRVRRWLTGSARLLAIVARLTEEPPPRRPEVKSTFKDRGES